MSLVPQVKITVPQVRSGMVVRTALRADLDTAGRADVTLVCAPAGYGKTMLLADWATTSTGSDTAWVSLDRDDNDPHRLWTSVVAALATCPSIPPDSRLHAPWTWRPSTQPEFLAELTDTVAQLPRPVRLILDDIHELLDPVAPPAAPHRPALRTARRPAALLPHRNRHPARTIRPEPHPHPGRHAAPTHRRLGRRAAPGRTRTHPDHQPRHVPRPVLRQRQHRRGLPDRRDPLRAARGRPRVPTRNQHQQPRPLPVGRQADRPGRRRQPARPPRPPHLATDPHHTNPRHLPHPGTPAKDPPEPPTCTPPPPTGGQNRTNRSTPSNTPPAATTPPCSPSCCTATPYP
jgi:hypothetical protein